MLIYKCDRCGKQSEDGNKFSSYSFMELSTNLTQANMNMKYIPKSEIYCEECTEKIRKFIQEK